MVSIELALSLLYLFIFLQMVLSQNCKKIAQIEFILGVIKMFAKSWHSVDCSIAIIGVKLGNQRWVKIPE